MTDAGPKPRRARSDSPLSIGGWVIVSAAVLSGLTLPFIPDARDTELAMWTFAPPHNAIYQPIVTTWNERAEQGEPGFASASIEEVQIVSLKRRMIAGFLGDVPVADLLEIERSIVGVAFQGPLDDVGFVDLTDRLESEGILERFNQPSLSPWTSRGRIFGLPHDVHPVMLGYRADIVEDQFGIDVSEIQTWDDFERITRQLITDDNNDGQPDRYPLAIWPSGGHGDKVETLLLQAGGGFFDEDLNLIVASDINARVLARLVSWSVGETRIAADVRDFDAGGNQQKLEGYAVFYLMPDWMCYLWRSQLPSLAGKVKVMPMPAWDEGGRRTSVWGGSMLGISKASPNEDAAWEFAKYLYLSDHAAEALYTTGDIITPVVEHWDNPLYDEPDAYFAGQPKGRLYINLAPQVPPRTSSPYNRVAFREVEKALTRVFEYAQARGVSDPAELEARAARELRDAEERVREQMARNVFFGADPAPERKPAPQPEVGP